jgi:chemotaxis protein MotB
MNKMLRGVWLVPLLAPAFLSGCVWQKDYDAVVEKNQQLERQVAADAAEKRQLQSQLSTAQQQLAAEKSQTGRLTGAMAYTVNSDLMFQSGSWRMTAEGQRIIAQYASQLAPTQRSKVIVTGYTDDRPIGAELRKRGVTSNQELSQKRAQAVAEYMVSQGVKPDMVEARGMGESNPVASNATPQGRSQNRRVEMSLAQ